MLQEACLCGEEGAPAGNHPNFIARACYARGEWSSRDIDRVYAAVQGPRACIGIFAGAQAPTPPNFAMAHGAPEAQGRGTSSGAGVAVRRNRRAVSSSNRFGGGDSRTGRDVGAPPHPFYGIVAIGAATVAHLATARSLGRALFVEGANALNRSNMRNTPYGHDAGGRVFGAMDTLMPIVPSAGFVVEF